MAVEHKPRRGGSEPTLWTPVDPSSPVTDHHHLRLYTLHRLTAMLSSTDDILSFVNRHRTLLADERAAEVERSALLLSNCAPKLLEQKGLALLSLGISSISVGLGGKTCVYCIRYLSTAAKFSELGWWNLSARQHIIRAMCFPRIPSGIHILKHSYVV